MFLPAWDLGLTNWGKRDQGPRILSSVVAMVESLFHERGINRRKVFPPLGHTHSELQQQLEQDKKCPASDNSSSNGNLGKECLVFLVMPVWIAVSILLSWMGETESESWFKYHRLTVLIGFQ